MSYLGGALRPLRHPGYRRFFLPNFVATIGLWGQIVAASWLVLRLSNPLVLGTVLFIGQLPRIFAPLAGVAVDRFEIRKILLSTLAIKCLCSLLLLTAAVVGWGNVWLVGFALFVDSCAETLRMPAHQLIMEKLVGRDDLRGAVVLGQLQYNLSRVVGPFLAGIAIVMWGEAVCFGVNAAGLTLLVAAVATFPVAPIALSVPAPISEELATGIRFVFQHPYLLSLLILQAGFSALGFPIVSLAAVVARDLVGMGPRGVGLITGCVGLGAMATGLVLAARDSLLSERASVYTAVAIAAGSMLLIALVRLPVIVFLAFSAFGGCLLAITALSTSMIQMGTPMQMRGRVLSLNSLAIYGAIPLGNILFGYSIDRIGVSASIVLGALLLLLTLLLVVRQASMSSGTA